MHNKFKKLTKEWLKVLKCIGSYKRIGFYVLTKRYHNIETKNKIGITVLRYKSNRVPNFCIKRKFWKPHGTVVDREGRRLSLHKDFDSFMY